MERRNNRKKIDNQHPVLYLAIRLQPEDLKHLFPIPIFPDYRVSINIEVFEVNNNH